MQPLLTVLHSNVPSAFKHGNYLYVFVCKTIYSLHSFYSVLTLRPWSDIRISKYRFFKYQTIDGVREPINDKFIILSRCYLTLCYVTEIIWIYFFVWCYIRDSWSCGMWHNVSEDPVASIFRVELCWCEFPLVDTCWPSVRSELWLTFVTEVTESQYLSFSVLRSVP